jgi:hypothetical protein
MPYTFTPGGNPAAIAEQDYAAAASVTFTRFTSCIGLLARNGTKVTGVHLVMFSNTDTPFDNAAANAAVHLLGNYSSIVVIGQVGMWQDNLTAPFQHLVAQLHNPQLINVNDGIYGGRVNNGVFQINQNGHWA